MNVDPTDFEGVYEKTIVDFLLELNRLCKAASLYPADHPTLLAMYVKPFQDISSVLDRTGDVAITYKRDGGFLWGDIQIAKRFPILREMGEELFRRKAHSVFFLKDLKLIELRYLVEVMTADPRRIHNSGGCEQLLQSKGVRHIWFNEIDYKKILENQKEEDENAPEIDVSLKGESEQAEGIYDFLNGEETGFVKSDKTSAPRRQSPTVQENKKDSFPEDINELIRLWNEAKSFGDFEKIGNILIGRLFKAATERDVDTILKVLNAFLAVSEIMKGERFGEFASSCLDRIAAGKGPLEVLLDSACKKDVQDGSPAAAIARLKNKAASLVADRLAIENDSHARHVLHAILVKMGSDIIPMLLERLGDERWYVVRNTIRILGEIGEHGNVEDALKISLTHPDGRVRKEAVRALSMIRGPQSLLLLRTALGDSDNGVVELSAVSLGLLRDEGAVQALSDLIDNTDDDGIKRETLTALGRIGSKKAVSRLVKTLERKKWLAGKKDDELKAMCAVALAEAGTQEAVKALEAGAESPRDAIRKACEDGLRRIRHGQ